MVPISEDQVKSDQVLSMIDAAISLPASLFELIDDHTNVGVFVALYKMSTLFPVDGGNSNAALKQTIVGSHVLATTVGLGMNFQNLDEPITVVLKLQVPERRVNTTIYVCDYKVNLNMSPLVCSTKYRTVCIMGLYSSKLDPKGLQYQCWA